MRNSTHDEILKSLVEIRKRPSTSPIVRTFAWMIIFLRISPAEYLYHGGINFPEELYNWIYRHER